MLTALQKRLNREEDGFTLIELMVVVLIIGILIAIAIPTFLGAQNRARDKAVESDLRNGITAAKTISTDDAGLMTNVNVASLGQAEGALTFNATGDTTNIGVVNSTGDTPVGSTAILLYKQSASNKWFGVTADSTGKVQYCEGAANTNVNSIAGCTLAKW